MAKDDELDGETTINVIWETYELLYQRGMVYVAFKGATPIAPQVFTRERAAKLLGIPGVSKRDQNLMHEILQLMDQMECPENGDDSMNHYQIDINTTF